MFHDFKPQEEAFIEAKVCERGGVRVVQEHDSMLRDLLEIEYNLQSPRRKGIVRMTSSTSVLTDAVDTKLRPDISERTMQNSTTFLKDLKSDLREDWKTAVGRNMTVFQRKFAVHQRQLQEELSVVIHEENNRIIRHMSAGPHERIRNEVCCLVLFGHLNVAHCINRKSEKYGGRWYETGCPHTFVC